MKLRRRFYGDSFYVGFPYPHHGLLSYGDKKVTKETLPTSQKPSSVLVKNQRKQDSQQNRISRFAWPDSILLAQTILFAYSDFLLRTSAAPNGIIEGKI